MSPVQWAFEYYAMREREKSEFGRLKDMLINLLGLNVIRPTNDAGIPKSYDEMTEDEREAYIPLTIWTGRDALLGQLMEQNKLASQIETATSDSNYEAMVAAIDAAGGDMEPILGSIIGVPPPPVNKPPVEPNAPQTEDAAPSIIITDLNEGA